jgi:hypothetical protein
MFLDQRGKKYGKGFFVSLRKLKDDQFYLFKVSEIFIIWAALATVIVFLVDPWRDRAFRFKSSPKASLLRR